MPDIRGDPTPKLELYDRFPQRMGGIVHILAEVPLTSFSALFRIRRATVGDTLTEHSTSATAEELDRAALSGRLDVIAVSLRNDGTYFDCLCEANQLYTCNRAVGRSLQLTHRTSAVCDPRINLANSPRFRAHGQAGCWRGLPRSGGSVASQQGGDPAFQ